MIVGLKKNVKGVGLGNQSPKLTAPGVRGKRSRTDGGNKTVISATEREQELDKNTERQSDVYYTEDERFSRWKKEYPAVSSCIASRLENLGFKTPYEELEMDIEFVNEVSKECTCARDDLMIDIVREDGSSVNIVQQLFEDAADDEPAPTPIVNGGDGEEEIAGFEML